MPRAADERVVLARAGEGLAGGGAVDADHVGAAGPGGEGHARQVDAGGGGVDDQEVGAGTARDAGDLALADLRAADLRAKEGRGGGLKKLQSLDGGERNIGEKVRLVADELDRVIAGAAINSSPAAASEATR